MSFVHLHTHTEYSLLDGASKVKDIVNKAREYGFPAAAITDHGMMHGVYAFYKECAATKGAVNPILGCEVYCAPRSRHKKEGKQDMANYHLILLVKNQTGYKNLIRMVSLASIEGFYNRPRIDWELLEKHRDGLICLSACVAGQVPELILENRYPEAKELAQKFQNLFGADYYIEVQDHGLPEQKKALEGLRRLAAELNIPIAATNDSHYTNSDEAQVQDTLMCVAQNKTLSDTNRLKFLSDQVYYKNLEEMRAVFPDNPEYLENTLRIAEKIDYADVAKLFKKRNYVPEFPVPKGQTEESCLRELVEQGIKKRYGENISAAIKERYEYELGVIAKTGFCGYFLIVSDFIRWAKQNDIAVGPGRGSAAGSIVSYALDITTLDPLKYNLLFERFLNPERISMPDIDIDFCIRRRGEVIDYVRQKYGAGNVAQIVTFGTMAARGVVRDVGRVMNIPLQEVDRLAKMIPVAPDMTLAKALAENPELKAAYENNPHIREHLSRAMKLEGLSRNTGMHAAGVVISAVPLIEIIPLLNTDGNILTQFTMTEIEEMGLLKMDFLGLRNLTMINDCLDFIQKNHGARPDLEKIPQDDHKTFELFRLGETSGIFQCESKGMRAMIKRIQPTRFEDIIAVLALYRPGPLNSGMVDSFIRRKHGKEKIQYDFAELEPYLSDTYGLIVYQEQVMQIATVIGGFTMSQADTLRKAMGKKKKDIMQKMREDFVRGAVAKNFQKKAAENIYDLCAQFAEYGFNKSHAAAYAVISYRTAWLKANYPLEFMAALLSSVGGDEDKTIEYINECSRIGISVLPPSVNESDNDFTPINGAVRFGLKAVKNFGESAAEAIVQTRAAGGVFVSFTDMCARLDTKILNKKSIEALIYAGALDSFGKRRAIFEGYAAIVEKVARQKKEMASGQEALFGSLSFDLLKTGADVWPETPEYLPAEKLRMEKETLGIFVSDHPLKHLGELKNLSETTTTEIREKPLDNEVKIVGILKKVRKILTRTNKYMAVAELEDLEGNIPLVCFPRDFEKCQENFNNDIIALISGKTGASRDEHQIVVSEVQPLDIAEQKQAFYIDLEAVEDKNTLEELKNVIKLFRGGTPVVLHTLNADISLDADLWITPAPEFKQRVDALIGGGRSWMA
ncbi:MAG: DNA polymerase III subunit alpha [Candidatus Margulisbacteria bacterium]|jgi:DNA polymerase-3 subunit alpha|nr:DNA polymerase III subunit alpha [Candidatus Margulisiibacteriota bacterium]